MLLVLYLSSATQKYDEHSYRLTITLYVGLLKTPQTQAGVSPHSPGRKRHPWPLLELGWV